MDMTNFLKECRQSLPGCTALALADLSTNMMLKSNSESPIPQEVWDALVDEAARVLAGPDTADLNAAMDPTDQAGLRYVVGLDATAAHLFLVSRAEPQLGFILICHRDVDAAALLSDAMTYLEQVAASD